MPQISRFTISAIDALVRDLAYAPGPRRIAQIEAAEDFVREIDVNQIYPHDFVVWRLTGYRPDIESKPAMHLGAALIADLVNFIQAVSYDLDLAENHANRQAMSIAQAAERMGVTDRTLRRYRKFGLVCHYICFPEGKRLGVFLDALDDFCAERVEGTRLAMASSFSRVSIDEAQSIIRDAWLLTDQPEMTASNLIVNLAQKYDRSRETIRTLLRNATTEDGQELLEHRQQLAEATRRQILDAWLHGTSTTELARQYERSVPAIHRMINSMRRAALVNLNLQWIELPTFQRDDAAEILLGADSVRLELEQFEQSHDALVLLDQARSEKDPSDEQTMAIIAAINWLKRDVRQGLDVLPVAASSATLDALETALRWATLLERQLIWRGLPTAVHTIEQFLGQPIIAQPGPRLIAALELATGVVADLVPSVDPSRDQRFSGLVAQAIDRSLARGQLELVSGRAAVRHQPGTLMVPSLFSGLTPTSRVVDPDDRLVQNLGVLSSSDQALMRQRWGLSGAPPKTIVMLARQEGTPPHHLARSIQLLVSKLWAHV